MAISLAAKEEDGCINPLLEDRDTDNDVSMNYATPVSILQDSMLLVTQYS